MFRFSPAGRGWSLPELTVAMLVAALAGALGLSLYLSWRHHSGRLESRQLPADLFQRLLTDLRRDVRAARFIEAHDNGFSVVTSVLHETTEVAERKIQYQNVPGGITRRSGTDQKLFSFQSSTDHQTIIQTDLKITGSATIFCAVQWQAQNGTILDRIEEVLPFPSSLMTGEEPHE